MATANFGVLYTQAGGGDINVAYVDEAQTFTAEQTFSEQVILNSGAVAFNDPFFCAIDVTGLPGSAIPNKTYVDAIVADAVGVRTDTINTWTAPQTFQAQVEVESVAPMIIGAGGIECAGIVSIEAVINANGGINAPTEQNDILGGNGQNAISSNPDEYYFEMAGQLIDINATFGVPTILYTKRSAGDPGDVCVVNLPDVTEEMYGKRLLFVCTLMPIQLNATIIRSNAGSYTGALLGLGESVSLVAMFLGADSGWYVYGHEGTINYS